MDGRVSLRIGDIEVRNYPENPAIHPPMDIVRWEGETCYSLAIWQQNREGADLLFIGDRPFKSGIDPEIFWWLASIGNEYLNYTLKAREQSNG